MKVRLGMFCLALAFGLFSQSILSEPVSNTADVARYGTVVAVIFTLSTVVMKITAIIIGYLVVRLGHDTLIRGVTGEIDFGFQGEGVGVKLKAASPGAAFVLAGAAIVIWGLAVDKPFSMKVGSPPAVEANQLPDKVKPEL